MTTKRYLFSGLASTAVAVLGLVPGLSWAEQPAPAGDAAVGAANRDEGVDARSHWNERESRLIALIGETADKVAGEYTGEVKVDWDAVKKSVTDVVFQRSTSDDKPRQWPASQLSWTQSARKSVERLGDKDRHADEDHSGELKVLEALAAALQAAPAEPKEEVAAKPAEGAEASGDDSVWRYRDKSGARTTKPRYKGQEPVN